LCGWQVAKTARLPSFFETVVSTHPLSINRLAAIQKALPRKAEEYASACTRCQCTKTQLANTGAMRRAKPPSTWKHTERGWLMQTE
jgi:hypothetical protein